MHRTACINLFSFQLQLLLRQNNDWMDFPVAVVSQESAAGVIIDLNKHAKQWGVSQNENYLTALSMCPSLKVGKIDAVELDTVLNEIVDLLRKFSPVVDKALEPGVFWIDCSGIERLYQSEEVLAKAVLSAIKDAGFWASVCIGASKFGTYALAKSRRGSVVLQTLAKEQAAVLQTQLSMLDVPAKELVIFNQLGIVTLGNLFELPADSVKRRFSKQVYQLHRAASLEQFNPLISQKEGAPIRICCQLDGPQSNALGLVFVIKGVLIPLLEKLIQTRRLLVQLTLHLLLDHAPQVDVDILPAIPTVKAEVWLELLRLKLESIQLRAGVLELELEAHAKPATFGQIPLFQSSQKRDLDAANRALARLRARFGQQSVLRATLNEGHLPFARYQLVPMEKFVYPTVAPKNTGLVRRIFSSAVVLNSRPVKGPAGIHLGGLGGKAVKEMVGPYIIEGGWWLKDVCREYYFARTSTETLWVYFDRHRRRWVLQGTVE